MATKTTQDAGVSSKGIKGIPWTSLIAFVVMVVLGVIVVLLTKADVVTDWLRWTVTILWIVYTLALGIHDFIISPGAMGANSQAAADRDKNPFDLWTISHTGAGVVFGVWYLPLLFVLILTIAWEFYEYFFVGFGDKESFINRVTDVGVALAGWLVVVLIAMAVTGASFPFIKPV